MRLEHKDSAMVPAPLNVNITANTASLPATQVQRKPLPQRQHPALAGAGALLLSGHGLPLTIKSSSDEKDKHNPGLGLEVPSMSSVYGSPTIDEYSDDPRVRLKRSNELLFADPKLVGRSF
jgi:hypothetical protein